MVAWRARAGAAPVENWVADGKGRIAFSRGARAFVALAMPNGGVWRATRCQTGLPGPAIYCDVAAPATGSWDVPTPRVRAVAACASNVSVDADGRADFAVGATGVHVVALHVDARLVP